MKALQIYPRLDHHHGTRLIIVIKTVLLTYFLLGTGDYPYRIVKCEFLGLNTLVHMILIFDHLGFNALIYQTPALDPSQGMPCMHQRYFQKSRQTCPDITGIGIMTVQDVWHLADTPDMFQCLVCKTVDIGP